MPKLLVVLIFVVANSAGCSYFTRPAEQPIIEKSLEWREQGGESDIMDTLAIVASRRLLVANTETRTFCAEPPPDVAESIARSIAASISAGLEKGDISGEGAAQFASNYQTAVEKLSPLSQGLKYGRDGYFALCQARSNWFMKNEDFVNLFADIMARASVLIAQEIPYLDNSIDVSQASVEPATINSESIEILDGMDPPKPSDDIENVPTTTPSQ